LCPIHRTFRRIAARANSHLAAPAREVASATLGKKIGPGENFFLHWPTVSPISKLTRREKKPDEAAQG
jgi:hypothetical protein